MDGDFRSDSGPERVATGEVQVDLREALSAGGPGVAPAPTPNGDHEPAPEAPRSAEPSAPADPDSAPAAPAAPGPPPAAPAAPGPPPAAPVPPASAAEPEPHRGPRRTGLPPIRHARPLERPAASPPEHRTAAPDRAPAPVAPEPRHEPAPPVAPPEASPSPPTAASAPPASEPPVAPQPPAAAVTEPGPAPTGPGLDELLPSDVYKIAEGREVNESGLARLLGGAREMLTSPPTKREEALDTELRSLRVRGLARGVTVALGSIKGGVGKTTLTLALADMLADSLRCGVLVVDSDLEWGTAADSTPQDAGRGGTLTDVLAHREQIHAPGDLAPFLTALPGGAQLLAGPTDPNEIEALTSQDMATLLELLRRFFPVILLDLSPGIGLRGTIPRWAFESADEIVAIATPTRGSLRRAGRMLAYLTEHHAEVPITLALNMVPHRPDEAVRRIITAAEQNGATRRYVAIPRDDALMRQLDAGLLDIASLDQPTRIAIKDLAAQLAGGWSR